MGNQPTGEGTPSLLVREVSAPAIPPRLEGMMLFGGGYKFCRKRCCSVVKMGQLQIETRIRWDPVPNSFTPVPLLSGPLFIQVVTGGREGTSLSTGEQSSGDGHPQFWKLRARWCFPSPSGAVPCVP